MAIIGSFYNRRMSMSLRIFWIVVICIYAILVMGLRYRVGIDTINYEFGYFFHSNLEFYIRFFSWEQSRDPLYHIICAFGKSSFWDFWTIQLIMSSITTICIYVFLFRTCKNPFLGIILYCILQWLYFSTEIVRESAAVGTFLVNFRNFQKGKYIKYYILSLISIGFHFSAIITWIIPLCQKLKFNRFFIICCVTIMAITPLVEKFNEILAVTSIVDRVDSYIDQADQLNINWRFAQLVNSAILPAACVFLFNKYKIHNSFKGLLLLQILLCFGTFAIPVIFSRFTNYTSIFVTVSLANMLISRKLSRVFRYNLWVLIFITQFHYYYNMSNRWIPYVSIFNPHQVESRENIWYDNFGK